ncbi:MAG TPA: phosphatase PAP2 family protein [Rhizomicrobium sp.]|jgi:hypothetical protein|nr:phosphatase PAP2 family protein [Rhizomicrobium sp.]
MMLGQGQMTGAGLARAATNSVKRTFAAHVPLYICAIFFLTITQGVMAWYGIAMPYQASLVFLKTVPEFALLGAAVFAAFEFVSLLRSGYTGSPSKAIATKLVDGLFAGDRPGNIFHALVTMTPLMIAFAAMKEAIPEIHPFSWDHTFYQWDSWLGAGTPWWMWLQPVLGYPIITTAINAIYDLWFAVMFGSLFWMAFAKDNTALRIQFLLAFAFSWFIAGNVLATIFSSAGPCFYRGIVGGTDPYAAQMFYLRTTAAHWPVWSVQIQDLLWHSYATGDGAVRGISAMPSMHLVIAALSACLGWRINRFWGWALTGFTAIVYVGSIHLAWHYASDGIAGIALAVAFWWFAGWIVRRMNAGAFAA